MGDQTQWTGNGSHCRGSCDAVAAEAVGVREGERGCCEGGDAAGRDEEHE